MQHFMKPALGATGAEIVPAQLLLEFFVPVYYATTPLNLNFGGETLPPLTRCFEEREILRGVFWFSWDPPLVEFAVNLRICR